MIEKRQIPVLVEQKSLLAQVVENTKSIKNNTFARSRSQETQAIEALGSAFTGLSATIVADRTKQEQHLVMLGSAVGEMAKTNDMLYKCVKDLTRMTANMQC